MVSAPLLSAGEGLAKLLAPELASLRSKMVW